MRKIILAIDALDINMPAVDFACYMALLTKSRLTGSFLENVLDGEMSEEPYVLRDDKRLSASERREITDENIHLFKEACERRGVGACIHRDRGMPAEEIISESRFADLVIVPPDLSFGKNIEGLPSGLVKDILSKSECPVLLSPQSFDGVQEIFFSYDGSGSSVFAIKQFTYLFPEFSDKKITVVEVNKTQDVSIKSKPGIVEWLEGHYKDLHFELLCGEPGEELFKHVFRKQNLLLVMGAYGRNMISSLIRESRAALILKTINLPLFIAHR